MLKKVLVINGPNLNLLGKREPNLYGSFTLQQINEKLLSLASELNFELKFFQSNLEGELVSIVQSCMDDDTKGILINPGAYGHTSIALRDALLATNLPFVEVHISNVFAREKFRHKSYLSDIASGVVIGFGYKSYELALHGLNAII